MFCLSFFDFSKGQDFCHFCFRSCLDGLGLALCLSDDRIVLDLCSTSFFAPGLPFFALAPALVLFDLVIF
jgi:hypothetical protein